MRTVRAKQLGIPGPGCVENGVKCFAQNEVGRYASAYAMYSSTKDFCDTVEAKRPNGITDWHYIKKYYTGTLDEAEFTIQLSNGATSFDHGQCIQAMNGILDGCDQSSDNPMNWKQGGTYTFGSYKYKIQPTRLNRVWPYPTEPKRKLGPFSPFLRLTMVRWNTRFTPAHLNNAYSSSFQPRKLAKSGNRVLQRDV